MKILHIIFSMKVGGTESMLIEIVNGQSQLGHDVSLLIINDCIDEQQMGRISPEVNVVRLGRKPGSSKLQLLWKLNRAVRRMKPDVVHLHNYNTKRLIFGLGKRTVCTFHALGLPLKYVGNIRLAAISDTVRADILSRMPSADVTLVQNGIAMDRIDRRPEGDALTPLRLVQVGRLNIAEKGQDLLVKALGILARRGVTDVEVTLIGDGPDRQMLTDLAAQQRVADRVHFEGLRYREYIYSHLKQFDAMVHPSRCEGFGLTVAEGMAAGLPLILTEYDGPWEVAGCGRYCLSVPRDDADALADAIVSLRTDYPSALCRAAEATDYVRIYDIARTCRNYISLYRTLG